MPLSVGTLVQPFVDASYFAREDETNFQCTGDKTDHCVGIITKFVENTDVYAMVKWLQQCESHNRAGMTKTDGWFNIDFLWEIGQVR